MHTKTRTTDLPVHPRTGLTAVGIVNGRPVWPILGGDPTAEEATRARLAEIDAELEPIVTEMTAFGFRTEALSDQDATRFDELDTQHSALVDEREPLARRAAAFDRVRSSFRAGRGLERPDGPEVIQRVDPYADLDAVRSNSLGAGDLRSRALAAVEQAPEDLITDEQRTRAESLLRRSDQHGRIARHMLLTGSDDYARAFEQLLGGLQPWQLDDDSARALRLADEHRRAMNEGTDTAGGFLVPFFLDPTIILTNSGSTNPFRQICRTESITGKAWHGVTSAGVTAEWLDEAQEVGDDSPSFAQPAIPVHRASAWLQATFEVTQDSNIASQVGMLLADARDNLEAGAFATGNGVLKPNGVVTAIAAAGGASVVQSGAVATYASSDVYGLAASMGDRWAANATWVMNKAIALLTRQFASGSGPQHAFWADLGMATPSQLLGRPVREASSMASAIATNALPLLVGDFRQYLIVDRIGMTVQYEPLVKGPNRRPTGEVGWFAHWRVGGDALVPAAFRLLKIR